MFPNLALGEKKMLHDKKAYGLRERNKREIDNLAATIWRKGPDFVASFLKIAAEYCSSKVTPHGTEEPVLFFRETVLLALTGPMSNPNQQETITNALKELSSILDCGVQGVPQNSPLSLPNIP